MKKSYHSTVVPTTVAKTTRRRSDAEAIVPVCVKPPAGWDVLMCVTPVSSVTSMSPAGPLGKRVARSSVIIYDFGYDARVRMLMDEITAATDPRFATLPCRPGKIVAIHLSYASRADQRGRRPQHPSYFFKPSSSVAPTGSTIERPAGTELLAFEGEIALVIGRSARR